MKCRNRECERQAEKHKKYCCDRCRHRENYLNKLQRKGKVPTKKPYLEKTKMKLITKVEVEKKKDVDINKNFSTKWLQDLWDARATA